MSISVQITGDVSDLTAKLAVAKEEVRAANLELRDMAQQMMSAGNAASAELKSGLAASAQTAAVARAELAGLNAELRRTQAETGGVAASFVGMREGIERTMAPMAALNALVTTFSEVFLVAFAGERILEGIEHVAELGANLQKLHVQTGVAVETLSGWHYAAEQVEVSSDSLDTSIKRLGRSIQADLKDPAGTAAAAFTALGISQEFLRENSNDLQAVFLKMADAFHAHADGATADAIAQATLGRGGVELIPVLREGSEAIQAQIDKQKELGSQITGEMAEAMEKHRQAVKDMGEAWSGFELTIVDAILPALTKLLNALTHIKTTAESVAVVMSFGLWKPAAAAGAAGTDVNEPGTPGSVRPAAAEGDKPEFPNFQPKDNTASQIKEITEDALNKPLDLAGGMSQFQQKYWAILTKESKDLSASIVADSAATAQELKQYADDNYQSFRISIEEQKAAAEGNFDEQLRLDQELITRAKQLYGEDAAHFREAMRTKFTDLRAQVDQQMQPWTNLVRGIGGSFQQMFNGVLQGTQTFRQMIARVGDNMLATFASMGIKMVETWALAQIRAVLVTQQAEVAKTGAVAAGEASRTAVKTAAAAEGKAVDAAAGSASVFGDAYKAAAGAFSAVAGIPYIGPFIAPAAAAAAFAAVMAFDVFSAAGGFDVGAGQTPLTQLHPREMVLPAGISEMFRGMARDGGGSPMGGSATIHNHFHFSGQNQNDDFRRSTRQMVAEQRRTFDAAMA